MGCQPAGARLHRRNPDHVHRPSRPVQGTPIGGVSRLSSTARPLDERSRAGTGEVDGEVAFAHFAAVIHFHRLASLLRRGHFHEAVAARAAVELISHQRGGDDRTGVEEYRFEIVPLDAVRQVSNVQKGFIHGREIWPRAMAMAKRGRGWHRRRARVNSRLAKRVKNTRFHALCVWATRSPIGQALQTQ